MKYVLLSVLMLFTGALFAQGFPLTTKAFPVELELLAEGLELETRTGHLANIATVTVKNTDSRAVNCEASFVNGPERPVPARVRLASGEETVMTQAFNREVVRVRVTLTCQVAD